MNKIAPRQLYFFLAAIAPVGKLILMPTQLAYFSKNDLLFPAAVNFLLQAGVIFLIMLLARSNLSLGELLQNTFGKVAAKIILILFSLFLFYAALMPLMEQKLLVQNTFYDTLPSIVAFAPFFLLSAYLCAKPLSSFGRTWDILAPIALVSFAGILIMSFGEADYGALAPAGAAGIGGFLKGTGFTTAWFYDSAIVLLLMGKFEYRKGMAWKSALCYLAGAAGVLLFLATFYGIFAETAVRQIFAFTKISKYFSGITVLGRIDYVFIYALALVMAFYCALPLQAGIDCIKQAYGKEDKKALSAALAVVVNLVLFTLTVVLNYQYQTVNDAITQTAFWLFPAFCILLPLLALLLRRSPREKLG